MAEQTAQRYLEESAPEYTADLHVIPSRTERLVLWPCFYVTYPSHTVSAKRVADDWNDVIVMKLLDGPFPLKVTEVYYTSLAE